MQTLHETFIGRKTDDRPYRLIIDDDEPVEVLGRRVIFNDVSWVSIWKRGQPLRGPARSVIQRVYEKLENINAARYMVRRVAGKAFQGAAGQGRIVADHPRAAARQDVWG